MNRREFLKTVAIALPALGAACARDEAPLLPDAFASLAPHLPVGTRPGLYVFRGADEVVVGERQRFPVGLTELSGKPLPEARARAWVASADGSNLHGPFDLTYRRYAGARAGDPIGFYVTTLSFPGPGIVDVLVQARVGERSLVGTTTFRTVARAVAPAPGDPAVAVATPTFDDTRGVARVCTRKPACPMHDVSLHTALREGRPAVLTIGSPLLCTSRTCGPVLDEVTAVRDDFGDRAVFVHAEPYKGRTATTLSATARRWRIETEPWTFLVDARGRVAARFEGPVVAEEIARALRRVV